MIGKIIFALSLLFVWVAWGFGALAGVLSGWIILRALDKPSVLLYSWEKSWGAIITAVPVYVAGALAYVTLI